MPKSRSSQISLSDTPYYHCVSRCVRRCFLCGVDHYSGKSFEHRRGWIQRRLLFLASIFSIDICAFAVMANHVHVVLHIDKKRAESWSTRQVISQWHKIHKGTLLTQKYLNKEDLSEAEIEAVENTSRVYRARLYDISWFMRNLNEYIARAANKEDEVTGRFWEGRFKSQALLNEKALVACMAYVDLNPVRANVARTPESSRFTSIFMRINALKKKNNLPCTLLPFDINNKPSNARGIPYALADYLTLLDTTGRVLREGSPGKIPAFIDPILTRLDISAEQWLTLTSEFEKRFSFAAGSEVAMQQYMTHINQKRLGGMTNAKALFN